MLKRKKPAAKIIKVLCDKETPKKAGLKKGNRIPRKARQINADGKIHRKNRKRNRGKVEASGQYAEFKQVWV